MKDAHGDAIPIIPLSLVYQPPHLGATAAKHLVNSFGPVVTRPVRGGAMLHLPEDAPSQSKGVLNKILEEGDSGRDQEGGNG